ETAKNVAAAFDAAERAGAVMVWNEGDAVWGARGTVGAASDRHLNAEVGDLLQRIESFRGVSIVTTNMRHAIDPAFLRRFRAVIDFPAPGEPERLRLWMRAFPPDAPVAPVNWRALAAAPLTGGMIRNIALDAAFRAADAGGQVTPDLIAAALTDEMRKQGLPPLNVDWERGREDSA
ncbi:MAG: AAA family ATPase, partial [Rubrimonas sp.]